MFDFHADGNATHSPSYNYVGGSVVSNRDWTYDAAGRMSQVKETVTANNNSVSTYVASNDGDGQPAMESYQENPTYSRMYMVHSSVMSGKILTRLDYAGNKWKTDFNVDGLLTVVQWGVSYASSSASIQWTHVDPQGLSEAGDTKAVYDPTGNYVKWQHAPTGPPAAYPPIASSSGGLGPNFGYAINSACILDGTPTDCSLALGMLAHRSAEQCPNNYCGADQVFNRRTGQVEMRPLTRDPDTGLLGYYPRPQKPTPEQRAADRAGQMLAQQRCRDFVRSLLRKADQLATPTFGGSIRTNFSGPVGINGQPSPNYPPANYALDLYRTALAQGRVSRAATHVGDSGTIGETTGFSTVQWNSEFYHMSLDEQAQHTIHESMHQEPTFDDYMLARAAGLVANGREPSRNDLRSVSSASQYLNSILFQYCH